MNNILVIVGMHRSMTSLITQWLHECGLHVGNHLYGAFSGNIYGHYEDIDFIELHKYILKKNDTNWLDTSANEFNLDSYAIKKSKSLVELKNSLYEQWGWKDPRTCLFLNHWKHILPNARYLIVYRSFPDVVNSLVRREFKAETKIQYLLDSPKYLKKIVRLTKIKKRYIAVWINYNKRILQFIESISDDNYLVIKNDKLLTHSEDIFNHLTKKWSFDLNSTSIESLFDASVTKKATSHGLKRIDKTLLKEAEQIEDRLNRHSEKTFT